MSWSTDTGDPASRQVRSYVEFNLVRDVGKIKYVRRHTYHVTQNYHHIRMLSHPFSVMRCTSGRFYELGHGFIPRRHCNEHKLTAVFRAMRFGAIKSLECLSVYQCNLQGHVVS